MTKPLSSLIGWIPKISSVKWSDPGHFLKAQDKFIFSFLCTLFLHIFDTQKLQIKPLKSPLGRFILHYDKVRRFYF